jgi:beta-glucuronidase
MNAKQIFATVSLLVNLIFRASSSRVPTLPYWPRYEGDRKVELLDGVWETWRLGSIQNPPVAFDSMNPNFDPSKVRTRELVGVPSCVDNQLPGHLGYRGVSFFRRNFTFNLTETGAKIQFQACSFYCRVWVNGHEIGDHRSGGYVAFSLTIPPQNSVENEIFVLVDNRFNATTAPMHTGGDFWHYGGIMRSVEIHALPLSGVLWSWRVYVTPQSLSRVNLAVHLTNDTVTRPVDEIFYAFDDEPLTKYSGIAIDGVVTFKDVSVPKPRVWSTTDPQLHTLTVRLNGAIIRERFGLRIVDIDQETLRVRINGEILKLVGWNHHTEWPGTSASPTDAQMDEDVAILREGGANFVRGAHYPQDPRWLDRMDESGMVMWSETLGPGVKAANMTDPVFLGFQALQLNEMMDNAMNHPSIAFWAFFNEGDSDIPEACQAYEMSSEIIKSRDSSRLVTYAARGPPHWDVCNAAADVVSINGYPGWYRSDDPKEFWTDLASYFVGLGKPFMISETGAGGIYEWSDNATAAKWTLAYQTKIIEADVEVGLGNSNISGMTLWHLFDFKAGDQNHTACPYIPNVYPPTCSYINVSQSSRPGGENHKGSIDFWRRKKPIFDIVAAKYNATKCKSEETSIRNIQNDDMIRKRISN